MRDYRRTFLQDQQETRTRALSLAHAPFPGINHDMGYWFLTLRTQ